MNFLPKLFRKKKLPCLTTLTDRKFYHILFFYFIFLILGEAHNVTQLLDLKNVVPFESYSYFSISMSINTLQLSSLKIN